MGDEFLKLFYGQAPQILSQEKKRRRKQYLQEKDVFASAPKSEPSDVFLTCSFLLLGSIFPASELTDAVCMWAVF